MFEAFTHFHMVENLYGQTFHAVDGAMGYTRTVSALRKPYATADGYICIVPYLDERGRASSSSAGARADGRSAFRRARRATVAHRCALRDRRGDRRDADHRRVGARARRGADPGDARRTATQTLAEPRLQAVGLFAGARSAGRYLSSACVRRGSFSATPDCVAARASAGARRRHARRARPTGRRARAGGLSMARARLLRAGKSAARPTASSSPISSSSADSARMLEGRRDEPGGRASSGQSAAHVGTGAARRTWHRSARAPRSTRRAAASASVARRARRAARTAGYWAMVMATTQRRARASPRRTGSVATPLAASNSSLSMCLPKITSVGPVANRQRRGDGPTSTGCARR